VRDFWKNGCTSPNRNREQFTSVSPTQLSDATYTTVASVIPCDAIMAFTISLWWPRAILARFRDNCACARAGSRAATKASLAATASSAPASPAIARANCAWGADPLTAGAPTAAAETRGGVWCAAVRIRGGAASSAADAPGRAAANTRTGEAAGDASAVARTAGTEATGRWVCAVVVGLGEAAARPVDPGLSTEGERLLRVPMRVRKRLRFGLIIRSPSSEDDETRHVLELPARRDEPEREASTLSAIEADRAAFPLWADDPDGVDRPTNPGATSASISIRSSTWTAAADADPERTRDRGPEVGDPVVGRTDGGTGRLAAADAAALPSSEAAAEAGLGRWRKRETAGRAWEMDREPAIAARARLRGLARSL